MIGKNIFSIFIRNHQLKYLYFNPTFFIFRMVKQEIQYRMYNNSEPYGVTHLKKKFPAEIKNIKEIKVKFEPDKDKVNNWKNFQHSLVKKRRQNFFPELE